MISPLLKKPSLKHAVVLCCVISVTVWSARVTTWAQTNPCANTTPPAFLGAHLAWPQNARVTVNINRDQFSQADFDCMQSVFANYNLANSSGSSGNASGVWFTLTFTSTPIATTVGGTAETAPTSAAAGLPHVYQVNRPPVLEGPNPAAFGQTGAGGTGEHRTSGVTNINSQITNCDALKHTLAHEIGHTLGLGECTNCAARSSVMVGGAAVRNPDGTITRLYNDTSTGLVGPTPCDDQVVKQGAGYNPATVNQPVEGGGGDGGGGDGGGGDGGGGGDDGGDGSNCGWVDVPGQCYAGVDFYDRYGVLQYSEPGYCDPPQSTYVCW
jgi:uncharacterized membrane protein YgcG